MSTSLRTPSDSNRSRAWNTLLALPQAGIVVKQHATAWLDYVAANDPERMEWHAARAAGIGGSEAGAVFAWYSGEMKARKGIASLVKDKLLLRTPERANADMMRGTVLENHICQVFEARLDREERQWTRRTDLEARVNRTVPDAYPWMRANVDAIYEIDGAVVIVDFKAPSEASLKDQLRTEGNDEYKAQLNHYAIVAEAGGIRPAALWLALYDYARVATDGVQIIDVPLDPVLQQGLVEASGELWNQWILKGEVPPSAFREEAETTSPPPDEIQEAASSAAKAKLLAEAALLHYENARVEVSDWVGKQGQLGDLPLFLGPIEEEGKGILKVTAERKLDMDSAVERLYDLGKDDTDIDDLKVPGAYKDAHVLTRRYDELRSLCAGLLSVLSNGETPDNRMLSGIAKQLDKVPARHPDAFDEDRVRSALVACGESPHEYERETVSATLDRRNRSDKEIFLAHADETVASFLSSTPRAEATSRFMSSIETSAF